MAEYGSIDDLLAQEIYKKTSGQPIPAENQNNIYGEDNASSRQAQPEENLGEETRENEESAKPITQDTNETGETQKDSEEQKPTHKGESETSDFKANDENLDEYGNEKVESESKTYTEQEVNDRINEAVRKRLARLKESQQQTQQPTQQQQQQAADAGFQYDAESGQDWQVQLKEFIIKTQAEVQQQQIQQQYQQQEQEAIAEFEGKLIGGMSKFKDFKEVVGAQPITNPMTMATRAMKDPAAFLYAAAKRHGAELQRISQLRDPYSQMVEIGRLEERMKKQATQTNAPKPISRTKENATVKLASEREPTIEDLIRQSDQRRLARFRR